MTAPRSGAGDAGDVLDFEKNLGPVAVGADADGCVVLTSDQIPPATYDRLVLLSAAVRWDAQGDASELWVEWRRHGISRHGGHPRLDELGRLHIDLGGGLSIVSAHDLVMAGEAVSYVLRVVSSRRYRTYRLAAVSTHIDVRPAAEGAAMFEQLRQVGLQFFRTMAARESPTPPPAPAAGAGEESRAADDQGQGTPPPDAS